ncbi:MAG TPA: gamma-glutamylcyclotransferase [Candidatus Binatus sp.]|nr:gamma-glutamylcyclotransferase [Candidatus Binatus sp.]
MPETTVCPDPCWYFAYASNLCRAIFAERRGMRALVSRRARLDGHRLTFDLPVGPGERGVANVEPDEAAHVWGAAYLLEREDCDRLDRSEGVHVGIYHRIAVDVTFDDGEVVQAFTYRSSWKTPGRKPSPRYLGLILDGAREHELPGEYVRFLESLERARDERVPPPGPGV